VTASVGVASFPEHAADAESLFRAADTAMYSVKRLGKNRAASRGRGRGFALASPAGMKWNRFSGRVSRHWFWSASSFSAWTLEPLLRTTGCRVHGSLKRGILIE
jgi:diguanylate cyclase with GGDEF domain